MRSHLLVMYYTISSFENDCKLKLDGILILKFKMYRVDLMSGFPFAQAHMFCRIKTYYSLLIASAHSFIFSCLFEINKYSFVFCFCLTCDTADLSVKPAKNTTVHEAQYCGGMHFS